ncbi:hypothetical protein RCL1_003272 [Eukaryota sp. TZLM3-RCL]
MHPFFLFVTLFCVLVAAHNLSISRPVFLDYLFIDVPLSNTFHLISLSQDRLLLLSGFKTADTFIFNSWYIFSHLKFISIHSSSLHLPSEHCLTQQDFSSNSFDLLSPDFAHLKTGLLSPLSEDIILIAFEFSSSNLDNQYDQLSLQVFSLLNLQESNTFEFIIENDLMSLYFNEFSLEQDQSIIANITITHNSNQCTTEFPHEVQFNSIVSCSFCISNTGYTNTSSLQIIDKSIELQTNIISYCSFLKQSVSLFLIVSDYKLVIRDLNEQKGPEIATPLSGVRSLDFLTFTDSTSLFMVLICSEKSCELRIVGVDIQLAPVEVKVAQLYATQYHSAAVLVDGTVMTWGQGSNGRLGHGNADTQRTPKTVDGIIDAKYVACGVAHSLVLRQNGLVLSFGSNSHGRLGDGTTATQRTSPVTVVSLTDVIAIAAGDTHSLALKSDGTVFSWGNNIYGQLGRSLPNDNTHSNLPEVVTDLNNVVTISTKYAHNLAVREDGSVASWGAGLNGRLGNGKNDDFATIQSCGSFSSALNVSASMTHSLILLDNGDLWVTGRNSAGQLGLGHTNNQLVPVHLSGYKFAAVATGAGASNIGILTNGNVVVWGLNTNHQLGDGTANNKLSPVFNHHLRGAYAFDIWQHTLVAFKNGTVVAWGRNSFGQVGYGNSGNSDHKVPVRITGLEADGI